MTTIQTVLQARVDMHQIGQIYVRVYEIKLAASGRSRRTVDGLRQHFRKRDGAASCAQAICAIPPK
jgi:hypothetical protein